jgi:hypothetical protein
MEDRRQLDKKSRSNSASSVRCADGRFTLHFPAVRLGGANEQRAMAIVLSENEIRLLKELKGAGERGRSIRELYLVLGWHAW